MAHCGGGPTRWATGTAIYLIQREKTFNQAILLPEKLRNSGKNRGFWKKNPGCLIYTICRGLTSRDRDITWNFSIS